MTYRSYEQMCRVHLIPALGTIHLAKLTAQHIIQLVARLQDGDAHSNRTIEYVVEVLSRALNRAVEWRLIKHNPAAHVDTPKVTSRDHRILTRAERHHFLATLNGHRLKPLYLVAFHLGLRQGELLALEWRHIDLRGQPPTLRVEVSKTAAGKRTIPLSPLIARTLNDHWHALQEERHNPAWQEHGLVFPSERGTPVGARNLYRHFQETLKKAGLPPMPFHDLRHTCASLLAEAGVHPSVARDILGHEDISTTMNIYTHANINERLHAMEKLQDVV